ncbi:MAG: DRTGG domain-containing protein [Clostridia bacterium]
MNLYEILKTVDGEVIVGDNLLDKKIDNGCGADLMSDVLACNINPHTLLITSLANIQVMRTADIVELAAILFVRGKKPVENVINLAKEADVPLITTSLNMFETCGKLYTAGLKGS